MGSPVADDLVLTEEEKQALLAHRRDSAPKRKGTLRGTDPESGAEYEIELTAEETAKLAMRHLTGLFKDDPKDGDGKDGKKPPAKPPAIQDYFKRKTS